MGIYDLMTYQGLHGSQATDAQSQALRNAQSNWVSNNPYLTPTQTVHVSPEFLADVKRLCYRADLLADAACDSKLINLIKKVKQQCP